MERETDIVEGDIGIDSPLAHPSTEGEAGVATAGVDAAGSDPAGGSVDKRTGIRTGVRLRKASVPISGKKQAVVSSVETASLVDAVVDTASVVVAGDDQAGGEEAGLVTAGGEDASVDDGSADDAGMDTASVIDTAFSSNIVEIDVVRRLKETERVVDTIGRERAITPQQERFCVARASGMSQVAAYKEAYDTSNMKPETMYPAASRLGALPYIRARVDALKAAESQRAYHDASFIKRHIINESLTLSRSAAKDSDKLKALEMLGRLDFVGAFVDRSESTLKDDTKAMTPEQLRSEMQKIAAKAS